MLFLVYVKVRTIVKKYLYLRNIIRTRIKQLWIIKKRRFIYLIALSEIMYLELKNITSLNEIDREALKSGFVSKYGHVARTPILMKARGFWFSSYLFSHSLATCLAVILWDRNNKEAMMVHITHPKDAKMFVEKMIERISSGKLNLNLEAAIVGEGTNAKNPIAAIVELVLNRHNIKIKVKELKKHYSKWVLFNIKNGKVISYLVTYVDLIVPVNT